MTATQAGEARDGAFGASVTEAAWLLTPYLVAMTVMQSIGGWLGDVRLPAR